VARCCHRWSQGETAGGPPWWHQACADPEENERDLEEIPDNVKQDLEIYPVRWIDEVLALALQDNPQRFERVSVVNVDAPQIWRIRDGCLCAG
jgi:hypothetical protein